MSLSLIERQNQQKALLNAGVISQAEYERRLALLAQSTPAAQPAAGHNQPSPRFTARRPEAQGFARAPYRFVPYETEALVLAEDEALKPIHIPKPQGLSAEIVVQWEAEGPLLIGQEGKDGLVTPMRWSNEAGGGFFIPGATLRGAIRSVAEIIGGGRLAKAHVNLSQAFALRDFTHKAYSNSREDAGSDDARFPLADVNALKAGWLRLVSTDVVPDKHGDESMLDGHFEIVPAADWYRIEAEDIWRQEKPRGNARDAKDFTKQSMIQKYNALGMTTRNAHGEAPATADHPRKFQIINQQDRLLKIHPGGPIKGHYAFSGKSPSGKKYEYVIAAEGAGPAYRITPAIWQRFVRSHSQAVKERLKPDGAWKDVPAMFRANPKLRLPVFYVGDLEIQDETKFAFGITRLFKVPHTRTLEAVLTASGAADPVADADGKLRVDPKQIDIVDALFGYVYETKEQGDTSAQSPADVARKSRVAFSPAELVKGNPQITQTVETVMMAPRPSFAPFYLKGKYKDYSSPEAVTIAGRKRYPVRQAPDVSAGAAFQLVKTRLDNQIAAIMTMNNGKRPGNDVVTRLQFLLPADQKQNLVFESRIRLMNVTQAELGLVLDAVTLGGKAGLRHAIGRAKPFGAGQMKVTVASVAIEWNAKEGTEAADAAAQTEFITSWTSYREGRLSASQKKAAYARMRTVFESCCNPAVGAALGQKGLLDYLRLREQPPGANRPENPYVRLRDMVKPMKNAAPPTALDVLLKI